MPSENADLEAAAAFKAARDAANDGGRPSCPVEREMQQDDIDFLVIARNSDLPERIERRVDESMRLRQLLALAYSGPHLYTDDGELQDNSKQPFIDYRRDSVAELTRKLSARSQAALQEQPQ